MKYKLRLITLALCLCSHAYSAEPGFGYLLSTESLDNGSASTVGLYAGSDVFYGGLSVSYIKSSDVIQYNNRKRIHPLYFFMGIKAPTKFSPFIEAGIDLPEAFIDDLFSNQQEYEAQADYYFSGGVNFDVSQKLSVSLYTRKYNFKFRENIYAPTVKVRPHSYGVGIKLRF